MSDTQNTGGFVIVDNPVAEDWPVTVSLPQPGGKFEHFRFSASIRVLSPDEYEALVGNEQAPAADVNMSEILKRNAPIFARLLTGWKGIKNSAGNEVPFSAEVLSEQIRGPFGVALSRGLWKAVNEVRFGTRIQDSAILGN